MSKLFKDAVNLETVDDYNTFIEESLKSMGFGAELDDEVFDLKVKVFELLYNECVNGSSSFDAEIFFDSMISDLTETFNAVNPSLLQFQRNS